MENIYKVVKVVTVRNYTKKDSNEESLTNIALLVDETNEKFSGKIYTPTLAADYKGLKDFSKINKDQPLHALLNQSLFDGKERWTLSYLSTEMPESIKAAFEQLKAMQSK